jgi:hypothetical protein
MRIIKCDKYYHYEGYQAIDQCKQQTKPPSYANKQPQLRPTPYCTFIIHETSLLLILVLLIFIILSSPVSPSLTLKPTDTLSPVSLSNCLSILLIDNTSDHECQHEDPDITTLHALPPTSLHTNLPETVDTSASAVKEQSTAISSLNECPKPSEETTKEDTLSREDVAWKPLLEEADRSPGCGKRTCRKGRHAESLGDDALKGRQRVVIKAGESRNDGKRREDCDEEASKWRESLKPESEISSGTRWVSWV